MKKVFRSRTAPPSVKEPSQHPRILDHGGAASAPPSIEEPPQYPPILHDEPQKSAINVILFGDTGSGKSSIVNMLNGGAHDGHRAKVSSSAAGETFKSEEYHKFLPQSSPDPDFFKIHDTAGVNEASGGKVTTTQAIDNFWKLLGKLEDGVHLLVLVIRGPRLIDTGTKNYQLLKTLTEGKVPIALVVTGLECEDSVDRWWRNERGRFDKAGMSFAGAPACITATRGPPSGDGGCVYDVKYNKSIEKVENLFTTTPTTVPYRQERKSWISRRFVDICDFLGMRAPGFNKEFYNLLVGYGIDHDEAQNLANQATKKRKSST